jgi:hypothetical protein
MAKLPFPWGSLDPLFTSFKFLISKKGGQFHGSAGDSSKDTVMLQEHSKESHRSGECL